MDEAMVKAWKELRGCDRMPNGYIAGFTRGWLGERLLPSDMEGYMFDGWTDGCTARAIKNVRSF